MPQIMKKASILLVCLCFGLVSMAHANASNSLSSITQVLDGTCGIAWGASQATAKTVMQQSPFEAALQIEDNEILVYSGKFAGFASEFVFLFFKDQLAEGLIVLYNQSANPVENLEKVRQVLAEKYGNPAITRSINGKPEYNWLFFSPRKPLPNYAYIKLFPAQGSFVGTAEKRKSRPVIMMMSADQELGAMYHNARAKAATQ